MKKTLLFLCLINIVYCTNAQEIPKTDFSFIARENLEYKVLRNTFYLICQEYTVLSNDNTPIRRGSNNYFGRAFAIGILANDNKLWFPKYIRQPWTVDPVYKEYEETHKTSNPKCTIFKTRLLNDTLLNDTTYKAEYDLEKISIDISAEVLYLKIGEHVGGKEGIEYADELINEGTLVTFYTSSLAPEKKGDVTYNISWLSNIEWSSDGISTLKEFHTGDKRIIGGALFQRIISPGKIEWKIAGFYAQDNGKWFIKSVNSLL
jgi:hypothetical protein